MKRRWPSIALLLLLCLSLLLSGCDALGSRGGDGGDGGKQETEQRQVGGYASVEGIPDYDGKAYVELEGNQPRFTQEELTTAAYEFYSELDSLGRCGYTMACVGKEIMPTEKRGDISSVKPSGWKNKEYPADLVDGRYLYNRCHLIGHQLTGEDANKKNLITGTRYLNIEGMLPFEDMIADYVKETGNHVMYRVTPIFVGNNLLASGVRMEGYSVEDSGEGICFHVFAYNVQPGITINYATGANWLNGDAEAVTMGEDTAETTVPEGEPTYVINKNTGKFHKPTCPGVQDIKPENREDFYGTKQELLDQKYTICGICKP
ncbi:MAG: DNA/RNA non-specific endonuclease [Clostridia bacterium]|nr:DNA/RNA non-specific endonuclease [Clostridia bacterium]